MEYSTFISAKELHDILQEQKLVIVDCQFILAEPEKGLELYNECHIPGAVYADMDKDLTGEIIPGETGRHPLPPIDQLVATFSRLGIDESVQVVAYDNFFNAIAARLWWMLRWLGHEEVAVMDGGIEEWKALGFPTSSGIETIQATEFKPRVQADMLVQGEDIETTSDLILVDSRSPERYRGEEEPFDPVAGHIPGAINAFYQQNLIKDSLFHDVETIRSQFKSQLGDTPAEKTTFYCGSGVTALVNVLAYKHAGLGDARLYAGSWSEWITDPQRPIAVGDED